MFFFHIIIITNPRILSNHWQLWLYIIIIIRIIIIERIMWPLKVWPHETRMPINAHNIIPMRIFNQCHRRIADTVVTLWMKSPPMTLIIGHLLWYDPDLTANNYRLQPLLWLRISWNSSCRLEVNQYTFDICFKAIYFYRQSIEFHLLTDDHFKILLTKLLRCRADVWSALRLRPQCVFLVY